MTKIKRVRCSRFPNSDLTNALLLLPHFNYALMPLDFGKKYLPSLSLRLPEEQSANLQLRLPELTITLTADYSSGSRKDNLRKCINRYYLEFNVHDANFKLVIDGLTLLRNSTPTLPAYQSTGGRWLITGTCIARSKMCETRCEKIASA